MKKSKVRLKKLGEKDESEIDRSERLPRQGWREAFRAAGALDQHELLLENIGPNKFDREEWDW